MPRENVVIPATDGFELAGTVYHPAGNAVDAPVVLISAATGVQRGYYGKYAKYLAGEGFLVVSYDYRGVGGSRPKRLRGFSARMRDWGLLDLAGVIDWIVHRFGRRERLMIGHSVGGQIFGLASNNEQIDAVLTVAAQNAYWGLWPIRSKLRVALFWYVLLPVASRVLGYFPSSRLGLGEDLPAGVALEWARWGRTPGYLIGALSREPSGRESCRGFKTFAGPLRAYSFADDTFAPRRSVEGLLAYYPEARSSHRHVQPADLSVKSIGHFGFFRDRFRDTLWRETLQWLRDPQ